jgi:streptogramin lyase
MLRVCVPLAALLALTACAGSDSGSPAARPSATEPSVEPAPYVDVGFGPVGLTVAEDGSVWVVHARDETAARIPAGATEPDLTVDVPGTPLRTTAAFGAVWVTSFEGKRLVRLDPATGEVVATIRTGAGPEGVAAGFDSVWVVAQDAGKLLRIDPATNAVSAQVDLEVGARLVEAGPDAMYVAHYADDLVLRVDPVTNAVTSSEAVCDGPQAMAVLDGQVWVTCTISEELVALDATTLEKVASVPVAGSPDSVLATPDGLLAVVAEEGPRLVVVDPATATVVAEQVLGQERALDDRANLDLALVGDEAWVSSFNADRVYHLPLPR